MEYWHLRLLEWRSLPRFGLGGFQMQSNIEKCRLLATRAHKGQIDKGGKPYILHPAYVADHVDGENAKCVAWLHDVVENSDS